MGLPQITQGAANNRDTLRKPPHPLTKDRPASCGRPPARLQIHPPEGKLCFSVLDECSLAIRAVHSLAAVASHLNIDASLDSCVPAPLRPPAAGLTCPPPSRRAPLAYKQSRGPAFTNANTPSLQRCLSHHWRRYPMSRLACTHGCHSRGSAASWLMWHTDGAPSRCRVCTCWN